VQFRRPPARSGTGRIPGPDLHRTDQAGYPSDHVQRTTSDVEDLPANFSVVEPQRIIVHTVPTKEFAQPLVHAWRVCVDIIAVRCQKFQGRSGRAEQRKHAPVVEMCVMAQTDKERFGQSPSWRRSVPLLQSLRRVREGAGSVGQLSAKSSVSADSIYAGATLPNPASVGLHESVGFRAVGVYRGVGYKLGGWHEVVWWHLPLRERVAEPDPPVDLAWVLGSEGSGERTFEGAEKGRSPLRPKDSSTPTGTRARPRARCSSRSPRPALSTTSRSWPRV
jgi:hypothetical protein